MVWSHTQRDRLGIEKETLEKYFRLGVTWIDPRHETKVEVLLKSNSDKEYKLRIYIPADFPNSCPVLVVVQPKILLLKNGSRLPESSSPFHTLPDNDGFHRICHFYPPDWTPDITLYQVFMKGRLWIEGYEAHLSTGKNMEDFLREQKFTPRRQNVRNNQREMRRTQQRQTVGNSRQTVGNSVLPVIRRPICYDLPDEQVSECSRIRMGNRLLANPRNSTATNSHRREQTAALARRNNENPATSDSPRNCMTSRYNATTEPSQPSQRVTPTPSDLRLRVRRTSYI